MDFCLIKDIAEFLSFIVTVAGIIIALVIYHQDKGKERAGREYEVYNSLDDKHIEFLVLCLNNSDLHILSHKKYTLTTEQKERRQVVYEVLISIFERAFLLYSDQEFEIREKQWRGWQKYMREWMSDKEFVKAWKKLGSQWDRRFIKYMNKLT